MCDHCGCRAYPAIAELTREHEAILEDAWRVAQSSRDGTDPQCALDRLRALLQLHVAKEETGLYPVLRATGDLTPETSDALESEHRELDDVLNRGLFDRRAYYALAAHVEHEEMELFPAAMFGFDDTQWETLEQTHRQLESATRQRAATVTSTPRLPPDHVGTPAP